jgi:hypothetical protein
MKSKAIASITGKKDGKTPKRNQRFIFSSLVYDAIIVPLPAIRNQAALVEIANLSHW